MKNFRVVDDDLINGAVQATYSRARLIPGATGSVAPLRLLIASLGLLVHEVGSLTRASAARHLREGTGRTILQVTDGNEKLAGFLYANAAGGWILVDLSDPLVRRRFSVAHEVGHFILHFVPSLLAAASKGEVEFREELTVPPDVRLDSTVSPGKVVLADPLRMAQLDAAELAKMESEANRFAASLLLPSSVISELVAEHGPACGGKRSVLVRRLAAACLVSHAAMRLRLDDLELGVPDVEGRDVA